VNWIRRPLSRTHVKVDAADPYIAEKRPWDWEGEYWIRETETHDLIIKRRRLWTSWSNPWRIPNVRALTLQQFVLSEYENKEGNGQHHERTSSCNYKLRSTCNDFLRMYICFTWGGECKSYFFFCGLLGLKPPAAINPYETCGLHHSPRTLFINSNAFTALLLM